MADNSPDNSGRDSRAHQGQLPDRKQISQSFLQFCEVIARLRAPDGCVWDKVQTMNTIKPYTLEETYELLEAIDLNENESIKEELGDVLLQVVLLSQIAADEHRFHIVDVIEQITEKMIRRHPHVFGDEKNRNDRRTQ